MQPMLGVVVEVGAGAEEGMVRVRREPHEPTDPGRGFYYCVGAVPPVDTEVWCMANFATGIVFGDFSAAASAGYDTISEDGTPEVQQPEINFGAGFGVTDNPAEARTDVTLDSTGPPIGSTMAWAGTADPSDTNWLICDGRAVATATYPALSAILGSTWNTGGEGAGMFRIPDLRGRVAVGAGTGTGLTARSVAQKAGAESVALTTAHMSAHDHGGTTGNDTHDHGAVTGNDTHDHGAQTGDNTHSHGAATGGHTHSHGGTTGDNVHYHGGDSYVTANTYTNIILNSGGSFNVVYGLNQLDNAYTANSDPHDHTIPGDTHSHTITGVTHSHTITGDTHNHTITGDTHNHTITSAGSGTAHDNMQPYVGMHQIIRVK